MVAAKRPTVQELSEHFEEEWEREQKDCREKLALLGSSLLEALVEAM